MQRQRRPESCVPRIIVCLAWFALVLCFCSPCLAGESPPDEPIALMVDGRAVALRLRGVAEDGDWLFNQSGQAVTVARDQLVVWGAYRDQWSRSWIVLQDGSLLVADLLGIDGNEVVIAGRLWPETRLPRSLVRAILFRPPLDSSARDALVLRVLEKKRTEDRLLLEHGDELRGTAPATLMPEPGAFHPEKIKWPLRGSPEPVELPLHRATALLFATDSPVPAGATLGAVQWVGMSDGSRLLAKRVARTGDSLAFELSDGTQLTTDAAGILGSDPFEEVVLVQPLGAGVRYLSDMEPVGYKHIPFLASSWPYHEDRSVAGGFLRWGKHLYLKGVGMHSSSRLAYKVPDEYQELQAELAIDERAGRSGSVIYRVYIQDQTGQWSKVFESAVIRGGQRPVHMRVDVRRAARIALIVDFADRADQLDHANWLNARCVR